MHYYVNLGVAIGKKLKKKTYSDNQSFFSGWQDLASRGHRDHGSLYLMMLEEKVGNFMLWKVFGNNNWLRLGWIDRNSEDYCSFENAFWKRKRKRFIPIHTFQVLLYQVSYPIPRKVNLHNIYTFFKN